MKPRALPANNPATFESEGPAPELPRSPSLRAFASIALPIFGIACQAIGIVITITQSDWGRAAIFGFFAMVICGLVGFICAVADMARHSATHASVIIGLLLSSALLLLLIGTLLQ